jgi:hypothetical protein
MDVGALAGVVLGAVLALVGGVVTARLKERRDARAAARLVWLELIASWEVLFGTIVQDEWPQAWQFSQETWTGQRDRVALAFSEADFRQVQSVYLALGGLSEVPPNERPEPVLLWPLLELTDRAVLRLGELAGVDESQLGAFRTPLSDRINDASRQIETLRATPPGAYELTDKVVALSVADQYPEELQGRATAALARQYKRARDAEEAGGQ